MRDLPCSDARALGGPSPHVHPRAQGLSIERGAAGARRILRVRGELDLGTAPELHGTVSQLVDDAGEIVLDLAELRFMDSTGLHCLLRLRTLCTEHGCRLVLTSPGPQVRAILDITGLTIPLREQGLLAE